MRAKLSPLDWISLLGSIASLIALVLTLRPSSSVATTPMPEGSEALVATAPMTGNSEAIGRVAQPRPGEPASPPEEPSASRSEMSPTDRAFSDRVLACWVAAVLGLSVTRSIARRTFSVDPGLIRARFSAFESLPPPPGGLSRKHSQFIRDVHDIVSDGIAVPWRHSYLLVPILSGVTGVCWGIASMALLAGWSTVTPAVLLYQSLLFFFLSVLCISGAMRSHRSDIRSAIKNANTVVAITDRMSREEGFLGAIGENGEDLRV